MNRWAIDEVVMRKAGGIIEGMFAVFAAGGTFFLGGMGELLKLRGLIQ